MKYKSTYEMGADLINEISEQQLQSKSILFGGITGIFAIVLLSIAILTKFWWLLIPTVVGVGFGIYLILKLRKTIKETTNVDFLKGMGTKLKVNVELNDGAIFYSTKFDNKKSIFSYKGIKKVAQSKNYFILTVMQKGQEVPIFVRKKDVGDAKTFLKFVDEKRKEKK